MTHVGKIGRLSKERRDDLSRRIENGERNKDLVWWLNFLPDVQEVLNRHFGGRAITEQNFSDWKQTGHLEWLRRQEARECARQINDRAIDLEEETQERNLSDRFATVLASEMTRLAMTLLEPETDPEKRWRRLCQIHRELSQMRRDDHQAVRAEIKRERWKREVEQEEEEEAKRVKQEAKNRTRSLLLAPLHNRTIAQALGGGETGEQLAEVLHCLEYDLPLDGILTETRPKKPESAPAGEKAEEETKEKPAKTEKSGLIVPNRAGKNRAESSSTQPTTGDGSGSRTTGNPQPGHSRPERQRAAEPVSQGQGAS